MLSMKHHHCSPINGITFLIMKFGFYCSLKQKENNNTVDSLSRTRKGPTNLFEIQKVRDRENYRKNQNFY